MQTPKYLHYTSSVDADGPDVKDVWDALTMMDAAMNSDKIVLLYSGYVIAPGERDHEYAAGWNREHVWPKSHAALSTTKPGPGTDIHNLHAADISVNAERGNKDFDDLTEGHGVRVVVDSSPPPGYHEMNRLCLVSSDAWEPADVAKGTVSKLQLIFSLCLLILFFAVKPFSARVRKPQKLLLQEDH